MCDQFWIVQFMNIKYLYILWQEKSDLQYVWSSMNGSMDVNGKHISEDCDWFKLRSLMSPCAEFNHENIFFNFFNICCVPIMWLEVLCPLGETTILLLGGF